MMHQVTRLPVHKIDLRPSVEIRLRHLEVEVLN